MECRNYYSTHCIVVMKLKEFLLPRRLGTTYALDWNLIVLKGCGIGNPTSWKHSLCPSGSISSSESLSSLNCYEDGTYTLLEFYLHQKVVNQISRLIGILCSCRPILLEPHIHGSLMESETLISLQHSLWWPYPLYWMANLS